MAPLRRAFAPEASWRRPDPLFRLMTDRLSFLFAVSLYQLANADRENIARFYASVPETATFVVFRTIEEGLLLLKDAQRSESEVNTLTVRVLDRIFTDSGCARILEVFQLFTEARPDDEVREVHHTARILAVASVKIAEATRQLRDFDSLVAQGAELAQRDAAIAKQSPVVQAWIAKHWQYCGGPIEKAFGPWLLADGFRQASQRLLDRLHSHGRE